MKASDKSVLLQNCNQVSIEILAQAEKLGEVTIEELKDANLEESKINELLRRKGFEEENSVLETSKSKILNQIKGGGNGISARKIYLDIEKKLISKEDLLEIGLDNSTITSINYYGTKLGAEPSATTHKDLPPMQKRHTDIYFVGLPGTGKSTMLAGILYYATKEGLSIPNTYSYKGSRYQSYITDLLEMGVLPHATPFGSFNYISVTLKDHDNKDYPFNIVEVPGELFKDIFDQPDNSGKPEIDGFMNFIKNDNKKILIFTIDALVQENRDQYMNSYNQRDVYGNLMSIFEANGVLGKTHAVYLVVNKFDTLKKGLFKDNSLSDNHLADEYLNSKFKNFFTILRTARNKSNNEFLIRSLAFSIGEVAYVNILKSYSQEYSKYIVEKILEDSFYVQGKSRTFKF